MIVSHKRKFVYIGPPRTASTTLHHWLSHELLGDKPWVQGEQHSSAIPPEALEYFTFASVREPLDRCVSLWRHYSEHAHDRAGLPDLTFAEFVHEFPQLPWLYRTSQAEILSGVRLDAVIRYHRLEADLRRLQIFYGYWHLLPPIPKMNDSQDRPPMEALYTPELESAVRRWWADDVALWQRIQRSKHF